MDYSPLNLLFWTLSLGFWILVSFLVVKLGHVSRFPLLCLYLGFVIIFHACALILSVALGVESPTYGLFYDIFLSLNFLLASAVYLQVYSLSDDLGWGRDWHLPTVLVVVLLLQFYANSDLTDKLLNGGNLFCGYLGLATLFRVYENRHRFHIGATLGFSTVGLLLPSVFYGFVEVNFNSGFSLIELETVGALARLSTLFAWIIFVYALSRNDPPRPITMTPIASRTAQERMKKNARELWRKSA